MEINFRSSDFGSHICLNDSLPKSIEQHTGRSRAPMRGVYLCAWYPLRLFFSTYFRWRIVGTENVPWTGPLILAANHVSYLDPPLVGCAAPREASYLARESLFRFKPFGALIAALNAFPVDREGGGAAGLRSILGRLAKGHAVLLFPEGTRSRDGNLQPFRSGVGLAVIKSGAPVVPVRIFGAYEAFGRHRKLPRPRQITVRFGGLLRFERECAEAKGAAKERTKQIYCDVATAIYSAIAAIEPPR